MDDFLIMTKDEFLRSYSYLTEEEYDETARNLGYRDLLELLGWTVYGDPDDRGDGKIGIEIGKYSPAGEDFTEYIEFDGSLESLAKELESIAYYFDEDEHIEMWIEAKRNGTSGVPSTRELVEDAHEIQKMLDSLAERVAEYEKSKTIIREE